MGRITKFLGRTRQIRKSRNQLSIARNSRTIKKPKQARSQIDSSISKFGIIKATSTPRIFSTLHSKWTSLISWFKRPKSNENDWSNDPADKLIELLQAIAARCDVLFLGEPNLKIADQVHHRCAAFNLSEFLATNNVTDREDTPIYTHSKDIIIYNHSLVGDNLINTFLEANRLLKLGGLLYIAELKSRNDKVHKFLNGVRTCGFELVRNNTYDKIYYIMEFVKVRHTDKNHMTKNPFLLQASFYRKYKRFPY